MCVSRKPPKSFPLPQREGQGEGVAIKTQAALNMVVQGAARR